MISETSIATRVAWPAAASSMVSVGGRMYGYCAAAQPMRIVATASDEVRRACA